MEGPLYAHRSVQKYDHDQGPNGKYKKEKPILFGLLL
jgi:hypothetical protein